MSVDDISDKLTCFTEDGRIMQVEYAFKAMQREDITAVALKGSDFAVAATQQMFLDKYILPATASRLFPLANNIGCAMAGRMSDAQYQIKKAKQIAYKFDDDLGQQIPADVLCRRVSEISQVYTQNSMMRVLGCSMILIEFDRSFDDLGALVYKTDPGANWSGFKACAAGRKEAEANAYLQRNYSADLSQNEAIRLALKCLTLVRSLDVQPDLLEVGVVTRNDINFRKLGDTEIEEHLREIDEETEEDEEDEEEDEQEDEQEVEEEAEEDEEEVDEEDEEDYD